MRSMFSVRSSPCPAPNLQSSPHLHAACAAVARRLPPSGSHLTPHRMPSFRLSAGRVSVQPAAELRHLQRHNHGLHVPGALLPVPCPQSAVEPSPLHPASAPWSPAAFRLPAHLAPHGIPSFQLSAGRKLLVQRQQAAHPLCVGGHLGLRLRWLWLELGSGKLRLAKLSLQKPSSRCA